MKRGIEWGEIDANPFKSVKAPRGARSKAVRFYTAGEGGKVGRDAQGAAVALPGMYRACAAGEAVQAWCSRATWWPMAHAR
jgi:hypothetical protein